MPKFSEKSMAKLNSCHPDLQKVFNEVIKHFDCTVINGFRGQAEQDDAYANGMSKKKFPHSKHNSQPSLAIDAASWPLDWSNAEQFYFFAGFVLATAKQLGVNIRWGGDWGGDNQVGNETFLDLAHFELV